MGIADIIAEIAPDIASLLEEAGEPLTVQCLKVQRNPDGTTSKTSPGPAAVTGYLGADAMSADQEGTETETGRVYVRGADLAFEPDVGDIVTQSTNGTTWRVTSARAIPNRAHVAVWKLEVER